MHKKLVNIGTTRLSMMTAGTQPPPVILEYGLLAGREDWLPVAEKVSCFSQVILYDRAGRGDSDPGVQPRTAQRMATELHSLLINAGIQSPYILVGHSLGGLVARLFAHQYPSETGGLVLVDPTHEDQFEVISAALPPSKPSDSTALLNFRRFWSETYKHPAENREHVDFLETSREARQVLSLGNLPVLLLVAEEGMTHLGLSKEETRRLSKLMYELHLKTAALSSDSQVIWTPGSGHFIQIDQPDIVVEAVNQMAQAVRAQKPVTWS